MLSDVLWGTFLVSIFVSSLFNCLIFTFTVMVNSLKISFSSMFPSAGSQFWVFRMHFVESSFNSWKLLKLFPRRFAQILTYFSENHKMKKYGILSTPCGYFMVFWANNLDISQYREYLHFFSWYFVQNVLCWICCISLCLRHFLMFLVRLGICFSVIGKSFNTFMWIFMYYFFLFWKI